MMPREAYSLLSDLEIAVQRSLYFLTQKVKFTIIVFAQQTVWCRTLLGQSKRNDTSKWKHQNDRTNKSVILAPFKAMYLLNWPSQTYFGPKKVVELWAAISQDTGIVLLL